jgi:hypothetical protein
VKKTFFTFLLFIGLSSFAQTTITCDSVLQTSTCAGGNVIIPFQTTGTFPFGCVFTAEFSDMWGNWGNPLPMGSTMFLIGGNGLIFGTIPASASFGIFYRVRIVSTNPVDTSSDSPNTIIVTQIAQLNQIVSNPGDSACPGDTITLTALNFANEYLWSTGDTTASIVVTTSGIYSVTTTDALACESTAHDTIVFDPALCTGIDENELSASLIIYPNPANGFTTLQWNEPVGNEAFFEITDVSGQVVRSEKIVNANASEQRISLEGISSGMYFIIVHSNGVSAVEKLLID